MSKRKHISKTDSIFSLPLPLVETFEEVQSIQKLYPYYDPYFIASGVIKERREKFNKLWPKYKPYADSNFINEITTNFHQRTWEMYIGNILLDNNIKIFSEDKGPEFIVKNDKDKDLLYIECVCTTKGDPKSPDSVIDPINSNNSPGALDVPTDKMILRIRSSIKGKAEQYEKWLNKKTDDYKSLNKEILVFTKGIL